MLKKFLTDSGIARKDFFLVFLMLFNAFTWWYITPVIIDDLVRGLNATYTQTLVVWSSYYVAIVISSIVGSILSNKIRRLRFLQVWVILGVVISPLPALLDNFSVMEVFVVSILLGISFGLGMPSCLAYFADCTLVENRGRISGITLLATNLSAPLFAVLFGTFNLIVNSIILAVWRAFGLIMFIFKPEQRIASKRENNPSFTSILGDKSFILYFIAWLMFCFIDRFEQPVLRNFLGDYYSFIFILGPLLGGLSAFVGGLLADRIGRKRVVLLVFAVLGIVYALVGIISAPLISWYFSLLVLSVSTGILWVLFILILWGDLAPSGTREKYYAIGTIPFFLTNLVQLLSASQVTLISETSAFSLAAFFLFLAVLPLLYAPETLPEKKIELRRLKNYIDDAKKIQQKYA